MHGDWKDASVGNGIVRLSAKKKKEACLEGHVPHVLLDVAGAPCPQSGTLHTWLCQSPGPLLKSPNSFPASRQVILMFTPTSFYPSHTQFLFPGPFIPPPRSDSFNYPSYFLQLPFPPSVQICFPLRTKHWPMVNRNDRIFSKNLDCFFRFSPFKWPSKAILNSPPKKSHSGVPWWLNGWRIRHCHCCGSGHYCDTGLFSGLGTSSCPQTQPKIKINHIHVF